ncbi:MAG: insulinase family protein [Planctomycetota bacterium]|nr:MAG: insulinase family protein [Planctomycetota bacterium]
MTRTQRNSIRLGGAECSEQRLANGLRVLVAERHSDPIVATVLCYRVGARDEREEEAGLSHFLEHMMFKGSPHYGKGAIDGETARLGGSNNAFTGHDHTAYWFELAADRWEAALAIEADRMRALLLEPAEFDAERDVVLEELAMGEDDPWGVLMRRVEAVLHPHHPYGRPIIGFEHTLRGATPDSMRAYHRTHYRPDNALLVVAGDVDRASALRAAERHLGRRGVHGHASAPRRAAFAAPSGARTRIVQRWPDAARRLCFAFHTCKVGTREDRALDVLSTVLGAGRLSRLQKRLVYDERLAVWVSVSNDTRVDSGLLWVLAEASEGVEVATLERAIEQELARLRNEPIGAHELARALALIRSSEAFECESISSLAQELAVEGVDHDWRECFDGGARYRGLGPRELRAVAQAVLDPERCAIGESLPGPATPKPRARGRVRTR